MARNSFAPNKFLSILGIAFLLFTNFARAGDPYEEFVAGIAGEADLVCDSARSDIQRINELQSRNDILGSSDNYEQNYQTYSYYIESNKRDIISRRESCKVSKQRCEIRRGSLDECFGRHPYTAEEYIFVATCYSTFTSCDKKVYLTSLSSRSDEQEMQLQSLTTLDCYFKRKADDTINCG